MEDRIENIIENIEKSFSKLNNSVELLKKAEEITTSATNTTSNLITEFETTISKIEKLVKTDFAKEYNKLVELQKQLILQLNTVNYKKSFEDIRVEIINKNFDKDFKSIKAFINEKELDERFKEIFDFALANNEILDSFQPTINNLSEKFTEVNLKLENKNFHKDFAYISQLILDKNFDTKFIELKTKLENKNFNTHFNKIEEVIINEKNSIVAVLNKNHNKLNSQIDKQEIEIKALKKYLLVFFSILIIGLVLLAFAGIIILKPSLF